ncbi:hypothetical protein K435DRAFT_865422 [Dendrothele bispora CBS 962.96]|uniref:Uncharacterized protein n=1 Tax=Dendrothele bispora (strain CBS 962.96) TaxID=1314807 RepID=A0A4S8LK27_DENBC|nr:hypothetical protein K435DRAFT_865422 [Dendrothele bispora CBS 962.96]
MLRSSSAPPSSRNDDEKEGRGTPGTPRLPTSQLPTPGPTNPRRRPFDIGANNSEPRNYESLHSEIHSVEPGYRFQGQSYIPESLMDEANDQDVQTGTPHDPRSPQEHRTPIPLSPQPQFGPTILNLPPQVDLPTAKQNVPQDL